MNGLLRNSYKIHYKTNLYTPDFSTGLLLRFFTLSDAYTLGRNDRPVVMHNTYKRQTSMRQVGLEPAISTSDRLHTYVFERAATGLQGEIKI